MTMSVEKNKALVRHFMDVSFNTGKLAEIHQMVSADFVYHHASGQDFTNESYKQNVITLFNGFPDARLKMDDLIAEGENVVYRWTITCTHTGAYQGIPPTGNNMTIQGINVFRVADGKIAEGWSLFNALSMMQQLGVVPPLGTR